MSSAALGPARRTRWDWRSVRDRLLGSARFQQWALAVPPARWVARRRARQLFDLCAGFVYSQVLAACVQLDVFAILAEGPQTAAALGARVGLSETAASRLLEAARTLNLVERRTGDRYGLGPLGAALRGNAGVRSLIAHHHLLYADLADPVALLRGEAQTRHLADYWAYAGRAESTAVPAGATEPYTALMAASQGMVAAEILAAYPLGRHRHVLDVGGGSGAFLIAAGTRAPHLHLGLFDLPDVAAQARPGLVRAGLIDRATVTAGDFRSDSLPAGADLVTLIRILHDHDDSTVLALLRRCHAALQPGGTLLVAEPMADTPGAEPVGHAYFGFYLLAMGSGRPRSAAELTCMLVQTGFTRVRRVPTRLPLTTSILVAQAGVNNL
jgi:demethylspheroidene O-methyltransferase